MAQRKPGKAGTLGKPWPRIAVFSRETILTMTIVPAIVPIVPPPKTLLQTGPTVKKSMTKLSWMVLTGAAVACGFAHRVVAADPPLFTGDAGVDTAVVEPAAPSLQLDAVPELPRDAVGTGTLGQPGDMLVGEPLPETLPGLPGRLADDLRLDEPILERMPDEVSSGNWFSLGQWYGSAESIWMDRNREYRRVVGRDVLVPVPAGRNKQGVFVTDSIPYDLAPGARITLGTYVGRDYLNRDQSLEFTYYGGFSFAINDAWNALTLNSGTASSFLVPTLASASPGFTGAQQYLLTTTSNFNSMEINWKLHRRLGRDKVTMSPNGDWTRHAERGWLPSLIIGPRVANVNETCSFSGRMPGQPLSSFGGDYNINAQNWLLGLNLGGELISQNEFFYWGLRGRAAPAISFTANQQSFNGVNNYLPSTIPIRDLDGRPIVFDGVPQTVTVPQGSESWQMAASQTAPGFLGDLTILAGWNITPNCALQCSYDFLWIGGLATATRQFNMNKIRQNPIDGGGQMFLNGFAFGINGAW